MKLILEIDLSIVAEIKQAILLLRKSLRDLDDLLDEEDQQYVCEGKLVHLAKPECVDLMKSDKPERVRKPIINPDDMVINPDDIDSIGNYWNPEIHSRTKSKNKKGEWKLKRGLPQAKSEENVKVENESILPGRWKVKADLHIPPDPAEVFKVPTPPIENKIYEHADVMNMLSSLLISGKITRAQIDKILIANDVPSLAVLKNYPDKFSIIVAEVGKYE